MEGNDPARDKAGKGPGPGGTRGLGGLQALISRAEKSGSTSEKGLPPVDKWEPDFCGDLDMRIARDGTWYYLGTPIGRPALVRLFSTVLRKDSDGRTYLVTPVEKVGITVDDAPFVAVEMHAEQRAGEQVLTLRTNVGDVIEAGPDHPIRFEFADGNAGVKPYLLVRGRLEALLSRSVMYELVGLGEEIALGNQSMFAVRSKGAVFPIMPAGELERLAGG
ncbi:MAG: DUF1285 domain-containing protein [Pseudomonadota bacterium]|nr:DUF1285 domain-containing protein [Pseudomonadota bacterium]